MVVRIENKNVKFDSKDVQCFIQIYLSVRMNQVKVEKSIYVSTNSTL